jgi:hypothetical protein
MNIQASHFLLNSVIFFPFAMFYCRSVIFCTVKIQPWFGTMNSKYHLLTAKISGLALMMREASRQRYLFIKGRVVRCYAVELLKYVLCMRGSHSSIAYHMT